MAAPLSFLVSIRWKKEMTAPSNYVPPSVLIVIGDKAFQIMFSQMFVAINKLIPDPSPYPD
jgi:hypothetical protein